MVWPFGSSKTPEPTTAPEKVKKAVADTIANNDDSSILNQVAEWSPVILTGVGSLGVFMFYQTYLKRLPNAGSILDKHFRRKKLFGKVTSVGDGDGLHLYHTPGGRMAAWGWLRRVPAGRGDLKGKTISIRLAGIDAPEGAHFGRPAQPFAAEAQAFLSDSALNRRVRAHIWKRDQYNRVIATVYCRRFLVRKDLGLELLKQGLATVYEAKGGVEWGGREEVYKAAEAKAKAKKLGIWSGKKSEFQSPREYKAQGREEEKQQEERAKASENKSWWRRLLGL